MGGGRRFFARLVISYPTTASLFKSLLLLVFEKLVLALF
jgi:hypothetical protein